ncbi:CFEM domain-containing protein [Colletotrichum tofieldiae]|uniref:CFEM domain-containing protein n=1 Tax=Colletotrichum tofieldiae TaxID=708197 RepID=A0A166V2R6_9PEZI|nr:CFEM domain-containing protein [Colletotrichum tofieldiae]
MVAVRFAALLVCFYGLGVVAGADLSPQVVPSCAIHCIGHEIGYSNCSIEDQECLCRDNAFATGVQACVVQNCTVKEALACHVPVTGLNPFHQWFRPLLFGLPTFFMIGRLTNKWLRVSPWGWDDTTIIVAYLVLAAFLPAAYLAETAGAGRDVWTLTPDQITELLLIVYIFGILYFVSLAFIKISIIFLYLRIFPDEKFRKVLWLTQVFNLLLLITFVAAQLALCQPLKLAWVGWTKEIEGKCFNRNVFIILHGAINVALDLWMLVLPLTQLYKLHMKTRKKLGIMLMFSIGIFERISDQGSNGLLNILQCLWFVSINSTLYLLKTILILASADSLETALWSHIELCVGVVVACLPSTRQVWSRFFPVVLRVAQNSKSASPTEVSQSSEPNAQSRVNITIRQDSSKE